MAGFSSVSLGINASTLNASHAVAIGPNALATGTSALAVGSGAAATGLGASAFGRLSSAKGDYSTAIGNQASAACNDTVAIGAGSVADRDMTVSIGAHGAERQIINVAPGTSVTDAVNVSQLRSVASLFGGGVGWNADGTLIAPTYAVAGGVQHTVGDALSALDTGLRGNVAYDRLPGGTPDYNSVTLGHGSAAGTVGLHNIAN